MARYFRIPDNAKALIELAKKVLAKHTADGAASPLAKLNMADFGAKNTAADAKHDLGSKLKKDAETAFEERDLALGFSEEQNSSVAGTVDYYVHAVRDVLLGLFKGNEQKLGDWGFIVDTSNPVKKSTPPA